MKKKKGANIPPGQPTKAVFVEYAKSRAIDPKLAGDQWEIWDAGDWCDNAGFPILNWKGKLNTFVKCCYGVFAPRFGRRTQAQRDRVAQAKEEAEAFRKLREDEEQRKQKD